jgi:hypothetical protein
MFQPDTMLPSQYFSAMRKRVPQEAEYRLVVAVLEDAIDCYQKHSDARDSKTRQLFEDAAQWVGSDDRSWPFSFLNICDVLGLDPAYVREGLRGYDRRRAAGRAKVVTLKAQSELKAPERSGVTKKAS